MTCGWLRTLAIVAVFVASCSPSSQEEVDGASATSSNQVPAQPGAPPQDTAPWLPLARDNLHDPNNPSLRFLQQPQEALSVLPSAKEGNHVDWVAALRNGQITPRTNIFPETKITVLDQDVIMEDTAGMPLVLFPHKPHTEWLDCSNCHDKIFKAKKGANDFGMYEILQGKYCGQCHGAVSFPLTQCQRCHSVDRKAELTPGTHSES